MGVISNRHRLTDPKFTEDERMTDEQRERFQGTFQKKQTPMADRPKSQPKSQWWINRSVLARMQANPETWRYQRLGRFSPKYRHSRRGYGVVEAEKSREH